MQKKALEVARQYEQEAKERLRRMSLMAAGLEVAGHKKQGARVIDEVWYEDKSLPSGSDVWYDDKSLPSGVKAQD